MAIKSLGRKLAKQILTGESYKKGVWWPPNTEAVIQVQVFTHFEDKVGIDCFAIEAKCVELLAGGAQWKEPGDDGYAPQVREGTERSDVIKMNKMPAFGNVNQFVGAALGSLMGYDRELSEWPDLSVMKALLHYFEQEAPEPKKDEDDEQYYARIAGLLLGILTDPQMQPFSGIYLMLRTTEHTTANNIIITKKWYSVPPDRYYEDEEED